MSNGFSNEMMLNLILERLDKMDEKQDHMLAEIMSINAHGCAARQDDLRRILDLETWKNRGIVGIITLAIGMLVDFILGVHK